MYTSHVIELDDVVVVVGEYYYKNKTMAIERRMNKRKRREFSLHKESSERNIKWKEGSNHKENAMQNSSTLNVFPGANAMLVCELGEALCYYPKEEYIGLNVYDMTPRGGNR
jgi:hypothetical protein